MQGVRPARHLGPGQDRHQRLALLRRPVPRVLHREPRRSHLRRPEPQRRQRRGQSAKDKAQAYDQLTFIPWNNLDPFFEAVVQATEEAVLNSLVANEDMTGRDGHRTPALPRDRLAAIVQASNTRG